MKTIAIIIFCILINLNLGFSLDKINEEFVKYVKNQKVEYKTLTELHAFLIKPAKNERDRAELFYYWIAEYIKYDIPRFEAILAGREVPEIETHIIKKGVCDDYSKLFKSLCDLSKIECYLISGYAKSGMDPVRSPLTVNHAWNIIKLEDNYEFVDCTWGSGSVDRSLKGASKYFKEINPSYVFVNSEKFREDHLPGSPKWQLLDHPISYASFIKNDNFQEMSVDKGEQLNFRDSIEVYQRLTEREKQIKESIDIYSFNSTYKNAFEVGRTMEIVAHQLSIGVYDLNKLEKAKKHYKEAKAWYIWSYKILNKKNKRNPRSPNSFVKKMEKGIKYCDYRIKYQF